MALPPGLIGNPTATERCTLQQFNTAHIVTPFPGDKVSQLQQNECPDGSAVGYPQPAPAPTGPPGATCCPSTT